MTNEELERRALAAPEISRLDGLEVELTEEDTGKFTGAQLLAWYGERRKIIELRAKLSGAMPIPQEAQENYD